MQTQRSELLPADSSGSEEFHEHAISWEVTDEALISNILDKLVIPSIPISERSHTWIRKRYSEYEEWREKSEKSLLAISTKLMESLESFNLLGKPTDDEYETANPKLLDIQQKYLAQRYPELSLSAQYNDDSETFEWVTKEGYQPVVHDNFILCTNTLESLGYDVGSYGLEEMETVAREIEGEVLEFYKQESAQARNRATFFNDVGKVVANELNNDFESKCSKVLSAKTSLELTETLQDLEEAIHIRVQHPVWKTGNTGPSELNTTLMAKALSSVAHGRHSLPEELNAVVLAWLQKVESTFITSENMQAVGKFQKSGSLDRFMSTFMGYTSEEVLSIRRENWRNVSAYISEVIIEKGSLESVDIENMHQLSSRNLLPANVRRYRKQGDINVTVQMNTGVPSSDVATAMDALVAEANAAVHSRMPDILFFVKVGKLYSDFIKIHPFNDGNGTAAVFFAESMAALRGYPVKQEFATYYNDRVKQALRNNPVALLIAKYNVDRFTAGKSDYTIRPVAEVT